MITFMRVAGLALFATTLACRGSSEARPGADSTMLTSSAVTVAAGDTTDPLASRSKGSRAAPVTVFEMSDFQCPFCRRFAMETFPILEKEYIDTGKIRWVFVNFPLTSIHPNAVPAAEFALCAGRSDRFWPAHDLLYETQDAWAKLPAPQQFMLGLADSIGVPRDSMLSCLQDSTTRRMVQDEATSAAKAGATSTPSFYIEGGLLSGAYPPEIFRQVLDSIHAVKTAAR